MAYTSDQTNQSVGFRHALLMLCCRISPDVIVTVDPADPMNRLPPFDPALRLATMAITNPQPDGVLLGATVDLLATAGFAYITFRSIRSIKVRGGLELFSFVDLGRGEAAPVKTTLRLIKGDKT